MVRAGVLGCHERTLSGRGGTRRPLWSVMKEGLWMVNQDLSGQHRCSFSSQDKMLPLAGFTGCQTP